MTTPSYLEDHISQIPALRLLMAMGWQYLPPPKSTDGAVASPQTLSLAQVEE